jgi:tetratricopeptide (TPR) repeat protein
VGEANTRNNLGDAYRAAKLQNDAVVSYRSALLLAENSRSIPDQFRALRGLAQSYLASRQYLQASKTLDQHLTLAQTEGNRREELISLRLSAQLYKTTGSVDTCPKFL